MQFTSWWIEANAACIFEGHSFNVMTKKKKKKMNKVVNDFIVYSREDIKKLFESQKKWKLYECTLFELQQYPKYF